MKWIEWCMSLKNVIKFTYCRLTLILDQCFPNGDLFWALIQLFPLWLKPNCGCHVGLEIMTVCPGDTCRISPMCMSGEDLRVLSPQITKSSRWWNMSCCCFSPSVYRGSATDGIPTVSQHGISLQRKQSWFWLAYLSMYQPGVNDLLMFMSIQSQGKRWGSPSTPCREKVWKVLCSDCVCF